MISDARRAWRYDLHVVPYQPMTLVQLGGFLSRAADDEARWRLIAEFLEEHRHEPLEVRLERLAEEPSPTGDEHWDVFLAALAEHLAAIDERRGPRWCEDRSLDVFWFPYNTKAARAEAIVHAPS